MARAMQFICSIALGMLVVLSLPMPVIAGRGVIGSFTVPLTISTVSTSSIGVSYATISWETNGNATSQVFYDTQLHANIDDYAYHRDNLSNLVTQHSISLTGLSSSTPYHYRVKSVIRVGSIELIATSQDYTFYTMVGVSGNGGDGGGITYTLTLSDVAGLINSTITMDSTGIAQTNGQITTLDGKLTIKVNAGTRLLNSVGQPLTLLSVSVPTSSLPPPLSSAIVFVYDLGPSGTTFVPPITLTMNYQSATLPPGVSESTLYIAYWNGSEWQALQSTVDTQAKTVTAFLSHFTLFALMGKPSVVPPTPTPTPTPTPMPTPMPTPASTTPTPTPTPDLIGVSTRWWLVVGLFVAIAVVALIVWFVFKRRKRNRS